MPEISSSDDGGSEIISYALYWNSGSGSTFTEITGETTLNTDRFASKTGLITGNSYTFKYKVKNIHGWSEESPEAIIYAAKAPDAPITPIT